MSIPPTTISGDALNIIQDEIAYVVTENGITLNKAVTTQLYQAILQMVNAALVGFTPVQQGGGTGQGTNKVYIGWSGSGLKLTVDATDEGVFGMLNATQTWLNSNTFNAGATVNNAAFTANAALNANAGATVNNAALTANDGAKVNGGLTVDNLFSTGPIAAQTTIATSSGNITANGGNIFANAGYVRATYGVIDNPSDTDVCPVIGKDFAHNHAAAGYQYLPGGMVFQWGTTTMSGAGGCVFNWGIALSTIVGIFATADNGSLFTCPVSVVSKTATSAQLDTNKNTDIGTIDVLVIGF